MLSIRSCTAIIEEVFKLELAEDMAMDNRAMVKIPLTTGDKSVKIYSHISGVVNVACDAKTKTPINRMKIFIKNRKTVA
jgi:hypothetical protein